MKIRSSPHNAFSSLRASNAHRKTFHEGRCVWVQNCSRELQTNFAKEFHDEVFATCDDFSPENLKLSRCCVGSVMLPWEAEAHRIPPLSSVRMPISHRKIFHENGHVQVQNRLLLRRAPDSLFISRLRPCRRPLCLSVGGIYWGLVICSVGRACIL